MFTLRTRTVTAGLLLAALVAACERLGPTGPPLRLAYGIFDAAHGGPPGFYFLPPDAVQPSFSGTFDAGITSLNPRIVICDVTTSYDVDCGGSSAGATPAVAVFTSSTPSAITLDPATPQYQVSWNLNCSGCVAGHVYRVHVAAGAAGTRRDLGYVDVLLAAGSAPIKLAGDVVVAGTKLTLPIQFRIEGGIPGGLTVSAAAPDVVTTHTDLITATALDLHGAPLPGVMVAWSVSTTPQGGVVDPTQPLDPTSGQTGAGGTTGTTLLAGTTAGTAVVTAASPDYTAAVTVTVHPPAAQPLYVANQGGNNILAYAPDAHGNAGPTAKLSGGRTNLSGPWGVAIGAGGKLYVANANSGSITVYPAGASGDVAPIATIAGPSTGLAMPTAVAVDTVAGRLYVADGAYGSITVYPAGANGNVAPLDSIGGPTTGLNMPVAIALDGAGHVYVANAYGNNVTAYATDATGDVAPTATIAGDETGVSFPVGLTFDATGRLWVSNYSGGSLGTGSVTTYAAGANGDAAPVATLAGGTTGLNYPWGIALDAAGQLHVANAGGNSITVYAAGATGDVAPILTIIGGSTGLNGPFGITF
jgi:6-phosphogluconolactonase (cycloisomerase 2 family)